MAPIKNTRVRKNKSTDTGVVALASMKVKETDNKFNTESEGQECGTDATAGTKRRGDSDDKKLDDNTVVTTEGEDGRASDKSLATSHVSSSSSSSSLSSPSSSSSDNGD